MSNRIPVKYRITVEPDKEYTVKVRIGDGQPGDNIVFSPSINFENYPVPNNPEWICKLGLGSDLKDSFLYIDSSTRKRNPGTNKVSSRVFINDELLMPTEGKNIKEVEGDAIWFFIQTIDFSYDSI